MFYAEKRLEEGQILRKLCERKKESIIEAEECPDDVHMLVEISAKIAVSSFKGFLKGKSRLLIYEKMWSLKYKFRSREFWCKGYYVDRAGKNGSKITEYIKKQLKEEEQGERLPFDGDQFKKSVGSRVWQAVKKGF